MHKKERASERQHAQPRRRLLRPSQLHAALDLLSRRLRRVLVAGRTVGLLVAAEVADGGAEAAEAPVAARAAVRAARADRLLGPSFFYLGASHGAFAVRHVTVAFDFFNAI